MKTQLIATVAATVLATGGLGCRTLLRNVKILPTLSDTFNG